MKSFFIKKLLEKGHFIFKMTSAAMVWPASYDFWKAPLAMHEVKMADSLRSKRFRLVSEQRKTEERYSRFWPREKWNKSQALLLRHFRLSFLVLCSKTARKRLLRRLDGWILPKVCFSCFSCCWQCIINRDNGKRKRPIPYTGSVVRIL